MKAHTVAQVKDIRQRIRLIPACCQRWSEAKILIPRDQAIEQQFINVLRLPVSPHPRIEIRRAALNQEHQRAWITRSGMTPSERQQCRDGQQTTAHTLP